LAGLENINPTTIKSPTTYPDINILNNPQLSTCAVQSICDALEIAGIITDISNNVTDCNSQAEVETDCAAVLPVRWTKPITAKLQGKQTLITWSVADQINNGYFAIQHSTNRTDFRDIGTQSGEGNLQAEKTYSFIHDDSAFGYNYYRIKQIDYDGAYSFSNIAVVNLQYVKATLYPNPTTGLIFIKTPTATQLSIYNHVGYLVKEIHIEAGSSQISLHDHSNGLYLFRIDSGEVWKVMKE
jgi:hypothetical protein